MSQRNLKALLLTLAMAATVQTALAVIAQEPLLNRPNTVSPNLALILDTSGSMDATYIYQYGRIDTSGMGPQGPESTLSPNRPSMSPDLNRIYYDPRVRYKPRVDYLGADMAQDAPAPIDPGWRVYIRDTTSTPTTACPAGAYTTGQVVDAACYYNPYAPPASLVVAGSTATYPNRIRSTTPTTTLLPKFVNRTDCVASATSCNLTEEGQNYSNWLKWYSTRGLMATTGIGHAFQPVKDDAIRLGWTTIKYINDNSKLVRGVSSYSPVAGGTKDKFFTWLYGQTFASGTPNLIAVDRVGQYFERTDSDGPYSSLPDPTSNGISTVTATGPGKAELPANHASCRRSFDMLVTDGYANGGAPSSAGNFDSTVINIPNAIGVFPYRQPLIGSVAKAPYTDTSSNTMADIAMYYWGRDLRTDLANRVPTISTSSVSNPSTWQNVSFYAVTLGIDGSLPQTTTTLASINSGTTPWPAPVQNQPSTIDDLWHATVNARGELLNANNNTELTSGLKRMFETIAGTPQTLSGVAVSTTFLKSGTRKYKPEYIPGTWSGKLSAIELDATTGNDKIPTNTFWQVENGVDPVTQDPISLIPALATRSSKVFTWNGSAGAAFNATNSGLSSDLVNYLMGDPSKELRKSGGIYRNRTAILGDIVNSSPAYIHDNVDMNYEKLVGSYGNYRAFVAAKIARPEGVLFVGANDGMLHGFGNNTGTELFAFVPKAVIPNLYKLSDTPYTHQYYVDGPNTETDAYLNSTWTNILLGTTGAGAKAVYAMDVTAPTAMSASSVLWEINSSTTNFGNLGYVLSDVQAGVVEAAGTLANDNWVAVFGNGFGSTSGAASLFVVNLKTGALLKEIVVDTSGNGLGGVRLVRDATQRVIGAYAGDLKGNMWKFDLTGSSQSNWKVGLGGSPLYTAGSTQPITATPSVVPHPSGGYVVDFGTGKFFESTDTTAPFVTQRLYGIWDKQAFGATTTPSGAAPVSGTTSLQVQTINTVTVSGIDFYSTSTNTVAWGDGLLTGKRGWYMDLPNSGQRVPYPVERLFASSGSTFILASTISPVSSAAADLCVQTGSGSGWVYIIDGITGSGPTKPTLDTNNDGVVNSSDTVVNGYQDPVDGRPTAISTGSTGGGGLGGGDEKGCIVTAQNRCNTFELKCGQPGMPACTPTPGSGSLLKIKKREWRQLFMR
jgi:type IV pilus assembly protein PilY1